MGIVNGNDDDDDDDDGGSFLTSSGTVGKLLNSSG